MKDWQDVMVEIYGEDWATKSYNVEEVGKMAQKLLPSLLIKGERQIVAEVLAEKIVDLGEEIAKLTLTVKLIKDSTGFYDQTTDRLSVQMNDLEREREELTSLFLKLYKGL